VSWVRTSLPPRGLWWRCGCVGSLGKRPTRGDLWGARVCILRPLLGLIPGVGGSLIFFEWHRVTKVPTESHQFAFAGTLVAVWVCLSSKTPTRGDPLGAKVCILSPLIGGSSGGGGSLIVWVP
jgi:hypothetical protein